MTDNTTEHDDIQLTTARLRHPKATRVKRTLIVVAIIFAVAVLAVLGSMLLRSRLSDAGRPVPAPRGMAFEQSQPTDVTGSTITLSSDVIQRAGIKTEIVGERLVNDSSISAVSTGTVQPNAYRATPVVSLVGGIVRKVNAELGQNVARGQAMVVIFSDELAQAQSEYIKALADLEEHHKHHSRTIRLVEIGAASREELEQTVTKLRAAESEVASLRQRLLLLGLSLQQINSLASAQISSEVTLPAPVSGTVIARSVNPGEVVQEDKELLRIADLSSVWVIGQVYEKDLARIRVGSAASVTSEAYPTRVFRGRVSYVDPTLDPSTRTAQVRVELANPRQVLMIGMYVNMSFATLGGAQSRAEIPSTAVQNIDGKPVVFVVTVETGVFAMRPVRLGPEINGRYPVLEGLSIGERVVVEGAFLLRAEWLKSHPSH